MGGVADRLMNRFQRPVDITQNIVVPEAQDAIAARIQKSRARFIRCTPSMLAPIDLEDKPKRVAGEIAEITTDSGLASKVMLLERRFAEAPP